MRSGIELLFLPRRMGRMPYGLAAERVGGQVTWIPILRIRHAYNHRCAAGQDSVRLAMSLRAGAGPALQDTAKEKDTAAARREIPAQDTLRRTRGHVHTAAHACQGLIRRGYAMVLQVDMSLRHAAGRHTASRPQRGAEERHWLAVYLEAFSCWW